MALLSEISRKAGFGAAVSLALMVALTSCANSGSEPLTESENKTDAEIVQELLDRSWAQVEILDPDAVRPEVDFVRFVELDEWDDIIASCLQSEGFLNVTANSSGGGINYSDIPDSQRSAFQLAQYLCEAMYPLDPKYNRPLSEVQLSKLYRYYSEDLVVCLREMGYETSPPPSLQRFVDSYYSEPWLPWAEASEQALPLGEQALSELEAQCPQLPNDLW
ncbi:MAG: hypothetical protein C0444_06965 [Microbacterium sp.]|nr:hypothetical protein [Microbacterium sp.]MBA4345844.1 hypothetical protein [Microbacterium sp.]